MKKIAALVFGLFTFFAANSQSKNPVIWSASYKSISATEGEIVIIAAIEKGWHIYSQDTTSAGPVPTSFNFALNKSYLLVGKALEIGAQSIFDKTFEAQISSFSDKAEFKQKINLLSKQPLTISFKAEYMSCNDMMCLPPKQVDLSVNVQ